MLGSLNTASGRAQLVSALLGGALFTHSPPPRLRKKGGPAPDLGWSFGFSVSRSPPKKYSMNCPNETSAQIAKVLLTAAA